jgi:hypothetical protein
MLSQKIKSNFLVGGGIISDAVAEEGGGTKLSTAVTVAVAAAAVAAVVAAVVAVASVAFKDVAGTVELGKEPSSIALIEAALIVLLLSMMLLGAVAAALGVMATPAFAKFIFAVGDISGVINGDIEVPIATLLGGDIAVLSAILFEGDVINDRGAVSADIFRIRCCLSSNESASAD